MKCPNCRRTSPAVLVILAGIALLLLAISPTLISLHMHDTNWMAPAPQWRW